MKAILFSTMSFLLLLFSCNAVEEKSDKSVPETEIKNNETSWKLLSDSIGLPKPLGFFLKPTSDTIILEKVREYGSDKTFHECGVSFEAIRPIDIKSLKSKIEEARKNMPNRLEILNNETIQDALVKNYALLEIVLLDRSKKMIENSTMISSSFDTLNNLTNGHGKIKFIFRTRMTDEETKRIIGSTPKYFSVRLSDKGIGLSKVYSDYIKSTKK